MTQKQRKVFYPTIFLLGASLIIWEITVFRNTIIEPTIPIALILIVGIFAFIIDFKNYKKTYNYSRLSLYIYSSMHYIIGFGFITCSIFMLSNFYFADQNIKTSSYEIIRTSSLATGNRHRIFKSTPTFQIKYNGKVKELVFPNKYYEERNSFSSVDLDIKKGLFGFDVIQNKKLK